ncbi:MAG: thiolase family protein [Gammaproteobacteria bacterium]|nr:thiolase family protein [Gammaproteobacteria bacterium]MCH1550305.1 thiolase family protein [Pseudomonadales bacterium]
MTKHVYLLSAARTPVGSFQGQLASLSAPELGAHAARAALQFGAVDPTSVDEVILGNVVSAGLKQAPARQAMRQAGLPDSTGATTINKVCGSGMKATMLATDLIRAGSANTVIAGGMESMSNAPFLLPKARAGLRMGHASLQDSLFLDGLEDAETGSAMGAFAQDTADEYQITRQAMDAYAQESVKRARDAIAQARLVSEIVPISIGATTVRDDEQPGRARLEKIPQLKPAFKPTGTITAANASSISDGASALIIAGSDALHNDPLARVVGHATHSIHPSQFTIAPVGAIQKLVEKIGWQLADVDLFEINEAFAMVTMLATQELELDPNTVNIYGGACAQGHPIGSTGSRLIVTLAHAMKNQNKKRGIAALCIGGGEATAIALERD